MAGQLERLPRAARTNPDHERNASGDEPHDLLREALALVEGQVGGLSSASQWRDAANTGFYETFDHRLGGLEVQLAPCVEGRHHRRHETVEHAPTFLSLSSP